MGFSASDVVPFTQARANLSELADQAKAGAEKIITKNGETTIRRCVESVAWADEIVIVGTRAAGRSPETSAAPVDVYSGADLTRRGLTDLQ